MGLTTRWASHIGRGARKASNSDCRQDYPDAVPQPLDRMVRARVAVVAAIVLLSMAGCATPSDQLASAASDASSAVSTARLATKQQAAGRSLLPTTTTVLSDAVTALDDAESATADVEASSAGEVAWQKRTLAAIRSGTDAVLAAQRTIATDAAAGLPALTASAKALRALSDDLEERSR